MSTISTKLYTTDSPSNVLFWEGKMPFKVCQGDIVFFGDGWGGQRIVQAYYDVDGSQELYIDDSTNEIKNHVKKCGLFNITRGNEEMRK